MFHIYHDSCSHSDSAVSNLGFIEGVFKSRKIGGFCFYNIPCNDARIKAVVKPDSVTSFPQFGCWVGGEWKIFDGSAAGSRSSTTLVGNWFQSVVKG